MSFTEQQVLDALRRVKGPDLEGNIVDLGLTSEVLIRDDRVYFSISVPADRAAELEPLRQAAAKVVGDISGVKSVTAVLTAEAAAAGAGATGGRASAAPSRGSAPEHPRVQAARAGAGGGSAGPGVRPSTSAGASGRPTPPPHDHAHTSRPMAGVAGVRHLVAVASGKGGVGKSTTAVNLALAFQANGLKAGILDADIYGPSQPRLLGLTGRPQVGEGNRLRPMQGYGLEAMSMGFLVDEGTPIIWRGPMVVSALNQMLREVAWGDLDVLVIDMPPGTGDVQLTMAQQVPLSGAIIVSTPQDLALIDARKGLNMFRKVDVPVLGIIENMSTFVCPKCGERSDIFGHGGARDEADKLGLPFLGAIPLHMDIRAKSDLGQPVVATDPDGPHAVVYRDIARRAWSELEKAQDARIEPPALEVAEARDALSVTMAAGASYLLPAEMLRVMSPSAEVQGHSPDQRVTVPGKRNVKIRELRPIGNYAVRIVFDDGHDTGLYGWSYLEDLGRDKDKRWNQYLAELKAKGLRRD